MIQKNLNPEAKTMNTMKTMNSSTNASQVEGKQRILVVGENGFFSGILMEYAMEVAKRLNYKIFALNMIGITETGTLNKRHASSPSLQSRDRPSGDGFRRKAESGGLGFEYQEQKGDAGESVKKILHEAKQVAFVMTGSDEIKEIIAECIAIPVFSVLSNNPNLKGDTIMAEAIKNKNTLKKTLAYGAISAALYAAVFTNAGAITSLFTKGGWYAALPVVTVFIFSFAHGAFASNLWSLLGIEATTKQVAFKTDEKTLRPNVVDKKAARKRPRSYAYINPFHRL
jgi:hypothetical protein